MPTKIQEIKECIEKKIDEGFKKFIIFPFGDIGIQVKYILNHVYGIQEKYILDNKLCQYNPEIKSLEFCSLLECKEYCLILACVDLRIYKDLKEGTQKYFPRDNIAELSSMIIKNAEEKMTQIGKYSYGPICQDNELIESIGSFCSFADGSVVVENHEMKYLTTHPMIYVGAHLENHRDYTEYSNSPYYFCGKGVQPDRDKITKQKRIKIGSDVWFGKNVIVTNSANIGNGVIAGAGAVITKDVPDYAVVVGVPARIMRYRFSPSAIKALNKIEWWNWTDDEIRKRYHDFYLPVEEFIKKYLIE